jgi:tRNA threonylcarbamoyladenosine biosynthesis protein TsaE
MTPEPHPSPAPAIVTHCVEGTVALGRLLGELAPPNTCIALHGNLGAGKTQLARGITLGTNVDDPSLVSSPTYVLLNIYPGPKPVFHLDAYRIASEQDLEATGLGELLKSGGITLIEWAERIPQLLPTDHLCVDIELQDDPRRRAFYFRGTGPDSAKLAEDLVRAWNRRDVGAMNEHPGEAGEA